MRLIIAILLSMIICGNVYANKEFAKRFPTDTEMEVYTPNNPPPGGTPGGTNGQLQYNNSNAFGGFGSWDGTTLTIPGGVSSSSTSAGVLKLYEASANGSNYVALKAANSLSVDTSWILPLADSVGCFKSDGSGNLSISSCSSGTVTSIL